MTKPRPSRWNNFVARMRNEAQTILRSNYDGVAFIHVSIFVNRDGEPELWWIDKSSRVEPSKDAKKKLREILS